MENNEKNIESVESSGTEIVATVPTEIVEISSGSIQLDNYDEKTRGVVKSVLESNPIDFDNPITVVDFGRAINEQIAEVVHGSVKFSDDRITRVSSRKLEELENFDEHLDKQEEPTFLDKVKTKALALIGREPEVKSISFEEEYRLYVSKIDDVKETARNQFEATVEDIKLKQVTIEEMLPLIAGLDALIEAGKLEQAEFDAETERLKAEALTSDDPTLAKTIASRESMSNFMTQRLDTLEKASIVYKSQVNEYKIQQATDGTIASKLTEVLTVQASVLESQGAIMVGNHFQEGIIEDLTKVDATTNKIMQDNAEAIVENQQRAIDLMLNGGITKETLQTLQSEFQKGVKTLKESKSKMDAHHKENERLFAQINETLQEYESEFEALSMSQQYEFLEESSLPATKSQPKVKKKSLLDEFRRS